MALKQICDVEGCDNEVSDHAEEFCIPVALGGESKEVRLTFLLYRKTAFEEQNEGGLLDLFSTRKPAFVSLHLCVTCAKFAMLEWLAGTQPTA